ncbi:MAG: hypothetical protein LBQ42_06740 [Synergistaceae bacterium]|jgi:hypothetical protein|nr:hypothetical protein [Synergistaceae bacterium]
MQSINILIENLLKKGNEEYIQMLFEKCRKGMSIASEYKKDSVSEDKLLELFENSSKDERIQWFFIEILSKINEVSISDEIFEYCLNYPTPFKETLLGLLAHMLLKKEQLEQLNQTIESPEAFYQLFLINLRDNDLICCEISGFYVEKWKIFKLISKFSGAYRRSKYKSG